MPITNFVRPDLGPIIVDQDGNLVVRPVQIMNMHENMVIVTGVAMKHDYVLVGYSDNTASIYDINGEVIKIYKFDAAVSSVKM